MNLSAKILQHRKRLGLSQEKLAEQLGVSRQAITRWEAGQSLPELEKVVRLSELFAVSCDELLKDAPMKDEPPIEPSPVPSLQDVKSEPVVLAGWFWMRLGGGLLLLLGVADAVAIWALSVAYPVYIVDWNGSRLRGFFGFLQVHEIWPVFWLFTGMGILGVPLLLWSVRMRRCSRIV